MRSIKADTIARTIVLALALANQVLAFAGKDALPFTEDTILRSVMTLTAHYNPNQYHIYLIF